MNRTWFTGWMIVLLTALTAIRLTLPQWGARGPLADRLDTVDFALVIAVFGLTVFIVMRLRAIGFSVAWAVAVFLWLVGCEPFLRAFLGDSGELGGGSLPFELAAMLVGFVIFLAVSERLPTGGRAIMLAGGAALFATISRPYTIIVGLDHVPPFGDVLKLSPGLLTFLKRTETIFDIAKGLAVFPSYVGNAILIGVFVMGLVAAALPPREPVHIRQLPVRRKADDEVPFEVISPRVHKRP